MTRQASLHMTWHIWMLVSHSPVADSCGRANLDLWRNLSQALAGQVRDRLDSMKAEGSQGLIIQVVSYSLHMACLGFRLMHRGHQFHIIWKYTTFGLVEFGNGFYVKIKPLLIQFQTPLAVQAVWSEIPWYCTSWVIEMLQGIVMLLMLMLIRLIYSS